MIILELFKPADAFENDQSELVSSPEVSKILPANNTLVLTCYVEVKIRASVPKNSNIAFSQVHIVRALIAYRLLWHNSSAILNLAL